MNEFHMHINMVIFIQKVSELQVLGMFISFESSKFLLFIPLASIVLSLKNTRSTVVNISREKILNISTHL